MEFFSRIFRKHDLKKGIYLVLLAWLSFSTLYMVSKLIQSQTTIPTMIFFRNVLGLICIFPWVIKHWPKSIEIKNVKIVFLRSLMGILNLIFIFLAIKRISLVNTTLLNNSAPFFVPFILWFWFHTPISHKLWPAVITGFIGIALILQPDKRIFNLGAVYALLSSLCLAFTIVTTRLTSKTETMLPFFLYFFAIGAVITAPFAAFSWKIPNWQILLGLLSLGLFSFIGQFFLFQGLKYGKAHQLAPFTYSTVIFSGIYEWLFWGYVPSWIAYIGMLLIMCSGIWIVYISPPKNE